MTNIKESLLRMYILRNEHCTCFSGDSKDQTLWIGMGLGQNFSAQG